MEGFFIDAQYNQNRHWSRQQQLCTTLCESVYDIECIKWADKKTRILQTNLLTMITKQVSSSGEENTGMHVIRGTRGSLP